MLTMKLKLKAVMERFEKPPKISKLNVIFVPSPWIKIKYFKYK